MYLFWVHTLVYIPPPSRYVCIKHRVYWAKKYFNKIVSNSVTNTAAVDSTARLSTAGTMSTKIGSTLRIQDISVAILNNAVWSWAGAINVLGRYWNVIEFIRA